jgi:hypothetical protein
MRTWSLQEEHQPALLAAFATEYAAAGGPQLGQSELKLRLDLSLAASLPGQLGVPPQLYKRLKKEQWAGVLSVLDPRIDGDGDDAFLLRSYLGNLVYRLTRWKRDGVYERLCAWAGVPPAEGTR